MKKASFLVCLMVGGFSSFSQQQYFVYIQEAGRQPFYAKIDKKIYSSSESGYMIIPKLADSTYQITIGFAKSAYPEQQFPVPLNKKDNGFELKNFGEKGWGLFNLQTLAVVMNQGNSTTVIPSDLSSEKKTDAFSELLANVVNDSAILYSAAKPKTPDPEKTPVATKADSTFDLTKQGGQEATSLESNKAGQSVEAEKVSDTTGLATKNNTAAEKHEMQKPPVERPFITKTGELRTDSLYTATYLEQYLRTTDTIQVAIASNDILLKQADPGLQTQPPSVTAENTSDLAPVKKDSASEKKPAIVPVNSDCKNFASDNDVDKLRVRLMAIEAVDDKLVASRKFFKARCFTVKQITALSELYPSDETKYRFFELSYPFISDPGNFYLLEEALVNDLFKTRFKGLIGK